MNPIEVLRAALAGRYEIDREIGSGGMATVYLARDTRHNRSVAIKVMNPELGALLGAERFLAEIQVTANLQHPNLLPLFDSGEADGNLYYVMPFVDGESLRARLDREKQLPIDEAVRIATAVANALDYAHSHNVIHRDLKPENILLQAGQPVIADFGIALAVSNAGGHRITQTGLSLGTPAYMSPEQATGDRTIDGRSDIYSLAAVTFEMLTGEPPHTGNTAQAIIARILTESPRGIRVSRPNVPGHVEVAVLRALEKLPADRWQTAQLFSEALQGRGLTSRLTSASEPAKRADTSLATRNGWREEMRRPVTVVLAATAVAALALGAWGRRDGPRPDVSNTVRFRVMFPANVNVQDFAGASVAFSKDGRHVAFLANDGPTSKIFVRALDNDLVRSLPGTDGAAQPFFSPDGRWIGFWAGKLQKVALDGSSVLPLADVPPITGASWSPRGVIVFSNGNSLFSIPDAGGTPTALGVPDTVHGEFTRRFPMALADGETVLYGSSGSGVTSPKIAILSLADGQSTILEVEGSYPVGYVDGYLVYATLASTVFAVPVDLRGRRVTGPSAPIATNVFVGAGGGAKAALSWDGSLAYQGSSSSSQILTVDARTAVQTVVLAEPRGYAYPRFSPDGKRFAYTVVMAGRSDIWIYDIAARTPTLLTSGGTINERPEWTPDGASVLFLSDRSGRRALWIQRADFSGTATMLLGDDAANYYEGVITKDSVLVYQVDSTGSDVYWKKLGETRSHPVSASPYADERARVSPDGKWVAFVSNSSGSYQVYVQPLPGPGERTQVSPNGGNEPVWMGEGTRQRLFFRDGLKFVEARYATTPVFRVDSLTGLFEDVFTPAFSPHANYDVSPDGGRFLVVKPLETARVMVVLNWLTELRARTGTKRQ